MYADRFTGPARFNPGGLAAAIGINVAVLSALMVAAPHVIPVGKRPPITIVNVPLDPAPEPLPPEPAPRSEARPKPSMPDAPKPIVDVPPVTDGLILPADPPLPTFESPGTGSGADTGVTIDPPKPAPPVIAPPGVDPRYAGDLQPAYPPAERRMGNEGRVTVRVLVGTDGRVKRVEKVSAANEAFFRATQEQALRRWRFRPGTRNGVPEEAWRTMTVTFVLE